MRRTEFVIHELVKPKIIMPSTDISPKPKRSPSPQQMYLTSPHVQRVRQTQLALKKKLVASQLMQNDPLLKVQSALQPTDGIDSISPQSKKKTFFLMKPSKQMTQTQTGLKTLSVIENISEEGAAKSKEYLPPTPFRVNKNVFSRTVTHDHENPDSQEFVKLGTAISLQQRHPQSPKENSFRITLRRQFLETSVAPKKEVSNSMIVMATTHRQSVPLVNQQSASPPPRSTSCTEKVEPKSKRKMFAGNRAAEPNRRLIRSINCNSRAIIPPLESENNSIFKATLYQAQNLFFRSAASGNSSPLKKKSILMDIDGIICSFINKVDCSIDMRPSYKPDLPIVFLRTDSMDFLCDLKAQHNIYLVASRSVPEVVLGKIIHKLTGFGVRGIILRGGPKDITDFREVLTTLGLNRQPALYSVHALPQDMQGPLTAESDKQILKVVGDLYPAGVRVSHIFCSHLYMDIPHQKFLDQDLGSEVYLITVNSSTLCSIIASLKHPAPYKVGQKESGRLLLLLLNERMLAARQLGIESILADLGILQGKERTFPFPLTHQEYRYRFD